MDSTAVSIEENSAFYDLEQEIKECINKGLLIFIKNGEVIPSVIGNENYIHSSEKIIEEIKKLESEGIKVDIEEVVDKVREDYNRPVFTLCGSTGLNKVHITCKEVDKVYYFVSEAEMAFLLSKCQSIETDSKNKIVQYILQEKFEVRTSITTHGVYIPEIASLTNTNDFISIKTVVNEFGM